MTHERGDSLSIAVSIAVASDCAKVYVCVKHATSEPVSTAIEKSTVGLRQLFLNVMLLFVPVAVRRFSGTRRMLSLNDAHTC